MTVKITNTITHTCVQKHTKRKSKKKQIELSENKNKARKKTQAGTQL